jgi:hypothetical protein
MATKINTPIAYKDFATFSFTTDLIAPYKYQWMRDGVHLVHGNNKSYTTPPLRPEDFSAKYSVQVFGQNAIETSAEVVIDPTVKYIDPIGAGGPTGTVAKGTPVVKPFSDRPVTPVPVKP